MSEAISTSRYDAAVARIQDLVAQWLETGLELFLELQKVEQSGDWRAPGHASFGDFLAKEFPNSLGLDRYSNVVRALDLYGVDFIRKVGVAPCHALSVDAIAKSPERIEKVRQSVELHIEERGVAPDVNYIRDVTRGIAKEDLVKPHRDTRRVLKLELLQTRLREAHARIRILEAENKRLKKELGKAASAPGKKGSSRSIKPAAKGGARKGGAKPKK